MKSRFLLPLCAVLLTAAISFGINALADSFTEPSGAPPNNNAAAPLDTSATDQSKSGSLTVQGGVATNGVTSYSNSGGDALIAVGRAAYGDNYSWAPLAVANDGATWIGGMYYMSGQVGLDVGSSLSNVMSWYPSGAVWSVGPNYSSDFCINGTGKCFSNSNFLNNY